MYVRFCALSPAFPRERLGDWSRVCVALHTSDPAAAGDQAAATEVSHPGYAPVSVVRDDEVALAPLRFQMSELTEAIRALTSALTVVHAGNVRMLSAQEARTAMTSAERAAAVQLRARLVQALRAMASHLPDVERYLRAGQVQQELGQLVVAATDWLEA